MIVPLLIWHLLCSKANSKNPPPPILEFTHGGANCRIISLTVIKPVTCSLSFIRKLKLLLVFTICSITCFSVSFSLLVTGESILDLKFFFRWRLPVVWSAPWSFPMIGSAYVVSVSVRRNSSTVTVLSLHRNKYDDLVSKLNSYSISIYIFIS